MELITNSLPGGLRYPWNSKLPHLELDTSSHKASLLAVKKINQMNMNFKISVYSTWCKTYNSRMCSGRDWMPWRTYFNHNCLYVTYEALCYWEQLRFFDCRDQYMGYNDLNRPPSGLSFFPTLSFAHSLPPLGEWCREVVRSRQWDRDIMVKDNRNKSARRRLSRIPEG